MYFRRLLFRWRRWLVGRQRRKTLPKGMSPDILLDHCTLLTPDFYGNYTPALGLKIVLDTSCRHIGDLIKRLDNATLTIRDLGFVVATDNQFPPQRRIRLDDYLVNDGDRPINIEEAILSLRNHIERYHEALEAVTDKPRLTYYHRQYNRLNEEVLKFIDALLKVNAHV